MTPTGISPSVRATRSATIIRMAPPIAARGRTTRAFGPTSIRTRWGITRPTKPISPLTETAAAVISDARPSRIARSRRTSTPRCAAASSPSSSPLRDRDRRRISEDAIRMIGRAPPSSLHDALSKLPSRYEKIWRSAAPDRYIAMASAAASSDPSA